MKYYINRTTSPSLALDTFFNDVFGDAMARVRIPAVDVYEDGKSYAIEADVAGYGEKDIKLNVEKHVLTIESEAEMKKAEGSEEKKDEKNYLVREISRPQFKRSFTLPEDADEAAITAETKDGILTIIIPKKEKAEQKRIEIKIN